MSVNNNVITNFYSNVVGGASPLEVTFRQDVSWQTTNGQANILGYNWCFDYTSATSGDSSNWEYTSENVISHIYVGVYGKKYNVALSANVSGSSIVYIDSPIKVKNDYIVMAGINPIRYRTNRNVNLVKFLPSLYQASETEQFLQFIQEFENELFSGEVPLNISAADISISGSYYFSGSTANLIPYGYSNSAISASTKSVEEIEVHSNTDTSKKMSILEKIYRLTEVKDPELIDSEYLQFFANNMGYNINVYRSEVGNLGESLGSRAVTDSGISATDNDRYLRFMLSNLPNWYKIKSTSSAVKVMLFSFALVGDIIQYYTNNYLENGQWIPDINNNLSTIPHTFYATPHFAIRIDIDDSTDLDIDISKRSSLVRAIESIRPINTVFRRLLAFCQRTITQDYSLMTRLTRFIRISDYESEGKIWYRAENNVLDAGELGAHAKWEGSPLYTTGFVGKCFLTTSAGYVKTPNIVFNPDGNFDIEFYYSFPAIKNTSIILCDDFVFLFYTSLSIYTNVLVLSTPLGGMNLYPTLYSYDHIKISYSNGVWDMYGHNGSTWESVPNVDTSVYDHKVTSNPNQLSLGITTLTGQFKLDEFKINGDVVKYIK